MEYELSPQEKKLSSVIELAASELRPSDNYSLSLYGLDVPRSFKRTLEQQFGVPFHRDSGIDLTLTTDQLNGELYAKRILIPTSSDGVAELYHTSTLGYIPSMRKKSPPIQPYSKREIMDMLAISQPVSFDPSVYHPWKSELLKSTHSWKLEESVEVIDRISDDTGHTIKIQNHEQVGLDKDSLYQKSMSVGRYISSRIPDSREHISYFTTEVDLQDYNSSIIAVSGYCIKKSLGGLMFMDDKPECGREVARDLRDDDVMNCSMELAEKALSLIRSKYSV